jgi:hypothetical protein
MIYDVRFWMYDFGFYYCTSKIIGVQRNMGLNWLRNKNQKIIDNQLFI